MIEKYVFDKYIKVKPNVSCIGSFDGVHKGHQELIKKTIELASIKNIEPYVITFDKDPDLVIKKDGLLILTTLDEKIKLFEKYGIKGVIVIPFDEEMMKTDYMLFKSNVLDKLNIDTLVCGNDFSFGYMGKGNYEILRKQGMNVEVLDDYIYDGEKISSTRIRKEIKKGNFTLANKMLGYEYKK